MARCGARGRVALVGLVGVLVALCGAVPASAAPAWRAATDVSVGGQDADDPRVAVDARGNAIAVWRRSNGPNFIVQGAVRAAGGAWQAPVDLSLAGQNAYGPQVAVDAQGNATAVWARYNGTDFIVQGAVRAAGGSWQTPVDLSAAGQTAGGPQVAVDTQGNATAVWARSDGANSIVQGAVRAAGGAWQTPVDLSLAGQTAYGPQVAVDAQGHATAVWVRFDGTDFIAQGAVRTAGGTWQTPVDLSAVGQTADQPQVAVDVQGNATAVWVLSDDMSHIVQGATRAAGGTWQTPVDLSAAGRGAFLPQVAVDAHGNATAVWASSVAPSPTSAGRGARGRRRLAGTGRPVRRRPDEGRSAPRGRRAGQRDRRLGSHDGQHPLRHAGRGARRGR